jgi:hypothetical protein
MATAVAAISKVLREESDGWHVYSEAGKHLGGPYSKSDAEERLRQIEHFKARQKSVIAKALQGENLRRLNAEWSERILKSIDMVVLKYNRCHDANGKFCSTGGGGGSSVLAAEAFGEATYDGTQAAGYKFLRIAEGQGMLEEGALSQRQRDAIQDYVGESYSWINTQLRNGTPENLTGQAARTCSTLASLTKKSTLPEDVTVYRGMSDIGGIQPGVTIKDLGFVSTSVGAHVAGKFALESEKPVLFAITLRKGSKGLALSEFGENEILLPPGSKFKVVSVQQHSGFQTRKGTKNVTIVHAEYLSGGSGGASGKRIAKQTHKPDRLTWDPGDLEVEASVQKYNRCHDANGKFCSTGGGAGGLKIKATRNRAWHGEQVETKTKLSKLESGALGEQIAIAYLQSKGMKDARTLNVQRNNFPVDLVHDHGVIEVKTGLVSNGKSAQQWRATIGQPGKKEAAWLKTASKEQKAAWNRKKQQAILARKQKAVDEVSKQLGKRVKASTMGIIINPDTKRADIYVFKGFHLRVAWNSPQAKKAYVGSVQYE